MFIRSMQIRPKRRDNLTALAVSMAAAAIAFPLAAQVITDGTVGPAATLSGPNFAIGANLGTQKGGNLFHSFQSFSLSTGQSANFSGPSSVNNVISRVTGGSASNINGTIRSEISGADFFLINPSGIVFGPDASLDVQGAFTASTANKITFPDGGRFSAGDPGASVLSVAPPEAFGFLSANPASIIVDRADLVVPEFEMLSLVGSEVTVRGEGGDVADVPDDLDVRNLLEAPSGTVNVVAVGSMAEVKLGFPLDLTDYSDFGSILFDDVLVRVNGDAETDTPAGSVNFLGGKIVLNNTRIHSNSFGPDKGGDITIRGNNVTITADREREPGKRHQTVFFTQSNGVGRGGNINFFGKSINFERGVGIFAENVSSGDGGEIVITGGEVRITASSSIGSDTFGSGKGGDVTVNADSLYLAGARGVRYTGLYTDVYSSGPGGTLTVNAGNLELDGTLALDFLNEDGFFTTGDTGIRTFGSGLADATGKAGDVIITADRITGAGRAFIGNVTGHPGGGGDVVITAGVIEYSAGIGSSIFGPGDGGSVLIKADRVTFFAGPREPFWSGIDTTTFEARRRDGSLVAQNTGLPGNIVLDVGLLELLRGGVIASATVSGPDGADISITADKIVLAGDGTSGVEDLPQGTTPTPPNLTGIFSSSINPTAKNAGNITIRTGTIQISGGAFIASTSDGAGDGGTITLDAQSILLGSGGKIDASTFGPGRGGNIFISAADSILLTDDASGFFVESVSEAPDAGLAGSIFFSTSELRIENGAAISTNSAVADGGNITIDAIDLVYVSSSSITTSVGNGTGGGGNIVIDPVFIVLNNALIQANAFGGPGGNITIVADNFLASPNSVIEASSEQSIDGTVTIDAPEIDLSAAVVELSNELLDAADRLAVQCSARGGETRATFIGRGRSGLPQQPADAIVALYQAPVTGTQVVGDGGRIAALPGRLEISCHG